MAATVLLDPNAGYASIAGQTFPLAHAGREGQLQLNGEAGPVLRPVRFGERSRAVWRAIATAAPRQAIAAAVLHAAQEHAGTAPAALQEIVALALAGADLEAPPLAETALLVARAAGVDLRQISELDAIEVDQLAHFLQGEATDGGWNSVVFAGTSAASLESIRDELADRLLRRGVTAPQAPADRKHDRIASARPVETPASVHFLDALANAPEHDALAIDHTVEDAVAHGANQLPATSLTALRWRLRRPTTDVGALRTAHAADVKLCAHPVTQSSLAVSAATAAHMSFPVWPAPSHTVRSGSAVSPISRIADAVTAKRVWHSTPPTEMMTSPIELTAPVAMPQREHIGMMARSSVEAGAFTSQVSPAEAQELAEAIAILLEDEATLRGLLP